MREEVEAEESERQEMKAAVKGAPKPLFCYSPVEARARRLVKIRKQRAEEGEEGHGGLLSPPLPSLPPPPMPMPGKWRTDVTWTARESGDA